MKNTAKRDYVAIPFSFKELKRLKKAAKISGTSVEEYVRSAILKTYNTPQLPRI